MFTKTTQNTQDLIDAARGYFAEESLDSFFKEYMKGKDDTLTNVHLDYLLSLIEVLEISLLIPDLDIGFVGSKVRSIIGPTTNKGANQIPPMEIITRELVFAPDGVYGLGESFDDPNVVSRYEGCPSGTLIRINSVMGDSLDNEVQGDTTNDTILSNL